MDPCHSAQDVTRCDLCEVAIVQTYCDFCHVNLCKPCIGEHISDEYDKHKVVPFQQRKSTLIYPQCAVHQTKSCKFRCKECNTSVCSICTVISDTHKGHTISTLSDIYHSKKMVIRKDINELENIIYPTYEEVAIDTETKIDNLDEEYGKLTISVTKQGEQWHREIENIVKKLKMEIGEIKIKHLSILKKHLDEIKEIKNLIKHTLINLNEIEESNKVSIVLEYSSRNKELGDLPPKIQVFLPVFSPKTIDVEQLYKLTPLSTKIEKHGYKLRKPETPTRELLEEPELITTVYTGFENLRSVICHSEDEIWTSAYEVKEMKCFNIQGSLIKEIKTKSEEWPLDIAVTDDGDLVYTDWETATVNKVKNGQTEEKIRFKGWRPSQLCFTSSGDLLINIFDYENEQTKIVRYIGFKEKQSIQFDEEGEPLYSGNNSKYITENRNLDICVADYGAGAVVVVNQAGKLRFRYTGHPSTSKIELFVPFGITTDSQSHILIADSDNHCIHILDQHGQFLSYIDNCDLINPYGLCVDKNENLFVTEYYSGNIKKIKFLK